MSERSRVFLEVFFVIILVLVCYIINMDLFINSLVLFIAILGLRVKIFDKRLYETVVPHNIQKKVSRNARLCDYSAVLGMLGSASAIIYRILGIRDISGFFTFLIAICFFLSAISISMLYLIYRKYEKL